MLIEVVQSDLLIVDFISLVYVVVRSSVDVGFIGLELGYFCHR